MRGEPSSGANAAAAGSDTAVERARQLNNSCTGVLTLGNVPATLPGSHAAATQGIERTSLLLVNRGAAGSWTAHCCRGRGRALPLKSVLQNTLCWISTKPAAKAREGQEKSEIKTRKHNGGGAQKPTSSHLHRNLTRVFNRFHLLFKGASECAEG